MPDSPAARETSGGVTLTPVEREICFHVGFRKAASSMLQMSFFSQHSQISNVGKGVPTRSRPFYEYLMWTQYADYDPEEALRLWQETVEPFIQDRPSVVFSHEHIAALIGVDQTLVAHRLKEIFPNGKIFLVIRNQFSLLASYHTHDIVTKRYSGSFEQWITSQFKDCHNNPVSNARFFEIIDLYDRLFGAERVCALPFEILNRSPGDFAARLSKFLGVDADESVRLITYSEKIKVRASRWTIMKQNRPWLDKLDRSLRPFVPTPVFGMVKSVSRLGRRSEPDVSGETEERLHAYYQVGNRRLAERLDLPLERYGYPT